MLRLRAFAVTLGFVLSSSVAFAAAAEQPFTFSVPQGWTDLGPTAPDANFAKLPKEFMQSVRAGKFAAMAMNIDHVEDGFAANFNAVVREESSVIDEAFVGQMAVQLPREVKQEDPSSAYGVVAQSLVKVGGVPSGRLVAEGRLGGVSVKQLVYLIPHEDRLAIVTFSASPATFERYLPTFDQTAQSTLGAKDRSLLRRAAAGLHVEVAVLLGILLGAILLGIAVGGVLVVLLLRLGRRQQQPAPQPAPIDPSFPPAA